MRSYSIPANYIMQHHPDVHWSYHIIGYYLDALILSNKADITILKHSVIKTLLIEKYVTLLHRKEIVPIEELPIEQKQELWEESLKVSQDKDERIKIAKCIYTLHDIAETLYRK